MNRRILISLVVVATSCDDGVSHPAAADAASQDSGAASSPDAALSADAAAADAGIGCGFASSYKPSGLAGPTPFGTLSSELESVWFANGCGAMSAHLTFSPSNNLEEPLVAKFALPALQLNDPGAQRSEPGDYDITVSFSACDAQGDCSGPFEADATLEVRAVVNDETVDPNTDFTLRVADEQWEIADIVVTGHSCAWTWNPC